MRWLRGGSLQQALERGPWNLEPAARLLSQIAGALAYAHRQGVVHRDVKPANVLLDEDGQRLPLRLRDRRPASWTRRTRAAWSPRRRRTSRPRRWQDEPLTPRSDLYGLGLLTFELLTGQRPPMDGALPAATRRPARAARRARRGRRARDRAGSRRALRVGRRLRRRVRRSRGAGAPGRPRPTRPRRTRTRACGRSARRTPPTSTAGPRSSTSSCDAVGERRLVAVVGPSGIGKSSVVKAGLVPALRGGALPGSAPWLVTDMFPGLVSRSRSSPPRSSGSQSSGRTISSRSSRATSSGSAAS